MPGMYGGGLLLGGSVIGGSTVYFLGLVKLIIRTRKGF